MVAGASAMCELHVALRAPGAARWARGWVGSLAQPLALPPLCCNPPPHLTGLRDPEAWGARARGDWGWREEGPGDQQGLEGAGGEKEGGVLEVGGEARPAGGPWISQ